jgi:DNA-binding response OmpR family regulator
MDARCGDEGNPIPLIVVVVEDEEVMGLFLRESLLEAGFDVRLLSEGSDVYEVLKGAEVSAAIIDVCSPDVTGDKLARQLRAVCPTLPLILTTGFDERQLEAHFFKDRDVRIIGKPFDTPQLLQQLGAFGLPPRKPNRAPGG